jgi:hypothetical protein
MKLLWHFEHKIHGTPNVINVQFRWLVTSAYLVWQTWNSTEIAELSVHNYQIGYWLDKELEKSHISQILSVPFPILEEYYGRLKRRVFSHNSNFPPVMENNTMSLKRAVLSHNSTNLLAWKTEVCFYSLPLPPAQTQVISSHRSEWPPSL